MKTRALAAALLAASLPASAADFKGVAKELLQRARREGVARVAVLPLSPSDASDPGEGVRIAEALTTQLVRRGKVQVVERGLLQKVLEEHALARSGLFDAATVRKLGSLLAVEALVTGTFATSGRTVSVEARLIHAESGVILAASRTDVPARRAAGAEPAAEAPAPEELLAAEGGAEPCADAPARVDALEASVLDLKARRWALRMKAGATWVGLPETPGATISDPDLRWLFYDLVKDQYARRSVRPLTHGEARRLAAAEHKAFYLYHQCESRHPGFHRL